MIRYLIWRMILLVEVAASVKIVVGVYLIFTGGDQVTTAMWIAQIILLAVLIRMEKWIKPKADKIYSVS